MLGFEQEIEQHPVLRDVPQERIITASRPRLVHMEDVDIDTVFEKQVHHDRRRPPNLRQRSIRLAQDDEHIYIRVCPRVASGVGAVQHRADQAVAVEDVEPLANLVEEGEQGGISGHVRM